MWPAVSSVSPLKKRLRAFAANALPYELGGGGDSRDDDDDIPDASSIDRITVGWIGGFGDLRQGPACLFRFSRISGIQKSKSAFSIFVYVLVT